MRSFSWIVRFCGCFSLIASLYPLVGQETPIPPAIAQEICERTGSAAVLDGSIAQLGKQYVLGLRANNCRSGEVLDAVVNPSIVV